MDTKSRSKRKSRWSSYWGWGQTKRRQVPYQGMFGNARGVPRLGVLPPRIEAVFVEGLRDPAGLRGIRLGRKRKQEDVDHALSRYPEWVVRKLYPGNFT